MWVRSKWRRRHGRSGGFSLLELLVVLAIMALLVGIVAPRVIGYLSRAKGQTASVQIDSLKTALDVFFLDVGRYPSREEGLEALVRMPPGGVPGWAGPYLRDAALPSDPWGRPFRYERGPDGMSVLVYSLGADDAEGGAGENADIGR